MAEKQIKTKTISITDKSGTFSTLFHRIKGAKKDTDIINLRQILSNEKARLLHITKTKKPDSLYKLAKLLGRDFKAVRKDIRLLEKFGFIELISSHKNGRERLRPVVDADQVVITINI
ncbi:HTH domain-containing protein [Candidatus Pacearchaeota archaeon]|nr:HTH domain-containing protein [Candidatus Pacearchaeota archaeon]MBD3283701.1 HTH domain-containing protein [Candidatus Pacearchaeota archaeon]